jgi:sortase B
LIDEAFATKAQRAIGAASFVVDVAILVCLIALALYGAYGIWDNQNIVASASGEKYAVYKPTADNTYSFEELQDINDDVVAWLDVYGTHIDYPIVQGEDNFEYSMMDVFGRYS